MNKIVNLRGAIDLSKKLRKDGKTITLAGGCFDILHAGHIAYLKNAKKCGDVLIVALESDTNVKRIKGKTRPVNDETSRARELAKFTFVDYIFILPPLTSDNDYLEMTKKLMPAVIAITANDPKIIQKEKQAKTIGGKVITVTQRLNNYSTTQTIETA